MREINHGPNCHRNNSLPVVCYALRRAWGLKVRGLEDFHLAGRSLRILLLTGTFCATIVGASSTLGMAGLGYSKGLRWGLVDAPPEPFGFSYLAIDLLREGYGPRDAHPPDWWAGLRRESEAAASLLIAVSSVRVIAVQIVTSGKVSGRYSEEHRDPLRDSSCTARYSSSTHLTADKARSSDRILSSS